MPRCSAFAFLMSPKLVAAADPQPLTSCSNEAINGSYYLPADLDCGGVGGVNLGGINATLELRGFTIRNADIAVHCGRCKVIGPGAIADSGQGIDGYMVSVENVTLSNIEGQAVRVLRRLTMEDSLVETSATGVQSPQRGRIRNSQIINNRGDGIMSFGEIDNECVHGNLKLSDTTVTGNNTDPGSEYTACQFNAVSGCADIRACTKRPVLKGTSSCGTSLSVDSGASFGVCSGD